jgi:YidC/Oxa1 family membrane protein insertase
MDNTKKDQRPLALFLCFFLFVFYMQSVWFPYFYADRTPPDKTQEQTASKQDKDSTQEAVTRSETTGTQLQGSSSHVEEPIKTSSPSIELRNGFPTDKEIANYGFLNVQTEQVIARISLLGGRVEKLLLNDYPATIDPESLPLDLVQHFEPHPLPLAVYSGDISDAWVTYKLVVNNDKRNFFITSNETKELILEGTLPDGRGIRKTYKFYGTDYFVDIIISLTQAPPNSSRMEIEWTKLTPPGRATMIDPYNVNGYVWFDGQKAHRESFHSMKDPVHELGHVYWVSTADKYFAEALISANSPLPAKIIKEGERYSARIVGGDTSSEVRVYLGPKSYNYLQKVGYELHRIIDFGWAAFISVPLLSLLQFLFGIFGNYGVAIVSLTILVRIALFPLNTASFKQMKAMQALTPELKKIRENTTDRQKQQQAMMELYKKHGVNPLGGCFPMLVQMPIFIGLYYALLVAIELRHAPFAFWINDLSGPEKLTVAGYGIPIMVILWVISMLAQQMMTPIPDPVQKKMMLIMPLVFGFILKSCPSGVTLYWLTSNLISIGQQKTLNQKGIKASIYVTVFVCIVLLLLAFLIAQVGS